ncbi:hypothetical protein NZ47_09025 [Anaerovibrio lipolyticus]|uniref:Filament cap protein n=1 Tax=Anaerovibrio lipolyticus TaxID=82374 RepID=A0A0B2JYC5_9FIRM|nr:flagellar filament capping protein FliD [Anaerovibrio lipolyticus]KHM51703.1 hypothetical protein NZ47_09025 [Anaerovibrio lipolyticus]
MGVNGIYGLSGSGLDIESLVKMGMSGKNKQYDKMEQQEIANTWLKEAYNDVYNDLTTYKYGTLSDYKMQSNMNAMKATSSNSSVVTATANGAAAAMNHTVEVTSVASNAYLQTTQYEVENPDGSKKMVNYGVTRANQEAKTSNKLVDVIFSSYESLGTSAEGVGTYKINGADTTVNGSDIAISLKLKDTAGKDAKEYTLTYTYDELFKGEKTLNDFASAIAKTGANIQGGYDTANDSFSLYNKTSGEDNVINIVVENENTVKLFNNLNLGKYDVSNNTMGDRITFAEPTVMPTAVESVDLTGIKGSAQATSMKDVLGLSATSVKNGDNYDITVKDKDGNTLGSFTTDSNGNPIGDGANAAAFSMNLSNGTNDATISFSLGELFNLDDVGKKSSLGGNVGLDEFAAKINAAKYTDGEDVGHSLGITAEYDAIKDSFSLSNSSGVADLTSLGTGANKSVADSLISSLNLVNAPGLTYKTVTNSNTLGDILGITSSMKMTYASSHTKIAMTVYQDGAQVASIPAANNNTPKFYNGTYAGQNLFSFDISDGTKSATVDVTYGDVINFAGMRNKDGYSMYYVDQGGTERVLEQNKTGNAQSARNNLGTLAAKIKAAVEAEHLNITVDYDDATGQFSLLNPNGDITITDGSSIVFGSKLNLDDGNPSSVAYKVSSGITRANTTSSDDSLAAVLGLTAVKTGTENVEGVDEPVAKLTVKTADGNSKDVLATDEAFSLKVGNGTSEETVTFTYADLFNTSGTGTLKGTADFSTLAAMLNGKSGLEVAYDAATGKLSMNNAAGDAILSSGDALGSALVSKLNITETEASKKAKEEAGQAHTWAGTNASVTIDGKTYDNDTNKLTVAGVTYTFLDSTAGSKATISVSQDTDKIVDYVKSFVDEYNKLLDSLNEKLSEKKYSDYKPLSKRQEEEMTEKQIDKWNEKAKSGLLYHDSEIQALVSAMREAIYTKVDAVDSQYNTLSSIGITTTNTKGHLTIDTDKLKKALADDPDCVYQLFASDQDSTYIAGSTNKNKITTAQSRMDYANTGVANRLYNVMTNHMSKISDIAGTSKDTDDQSYLGKLITNMQTKMKSFKTLMSSYENKLYKRYDAMEVALSRLNMQLGYISGSFS